MISDAASGFAESFVFLHLPGAEIQAIKGYSTVARDFFNFSQEFFVMDLTKDFYAELFKTAVI